MDDRKYYRDTETLIERDADGAETVTTKEKLSAIERSTEPDYIKLYTDVWCTFNEVPAKWQPLFLQLAQRMSYCDVNDTCGGQLVNTGRPWGDDIKRRLKIGDRYYQEGLSALCAAGAIKKISRGVYQINPEYVGRGSWRYDPRLQRGGVEDLVATFHFKDRSCNTQIIWADDGEDTPQNNTWRTGLGVKAPEEAILKTRKANPNPNPMVEKTGVLS